VAGRHRPLIAVVAREQLGGEAPERVERALGPCVTLIRPVAEPHEPAAAEAMVVAGLLERLGGNRREARIRGGDQRLVDLELPAVAEPLAHGGVSAFAL